MQNVTVLDPGKVADYFDTIIDSRPRMFWSDLELGEETAHNMTMQIKAVACPVVPFTGSEVEAGDGSRTISLLPRPSDVIDGNGRLHSSIADGKVTLGSLPIATETSYVQTGQSEEDFSLRVIDRWRQDRAQFQPEYYSVANLAWDHQGNWNPLTPKMREAIHGLPVDYTLCGTYVGAESMMRDQIRETLVANAEHMAPAVLIAQAILKVYDE